LGNGICPCVERKSKDRRYVALFLQSAMPQYYKYHVSKVLFATCSQTFRWRSITLHLLYNVMLMWTETNKKDFRHRPALFVIKRDNGPDSIVISKVTITRRRLHHPIPERFGKICSRALSKITIRVASLNVMVTSIRC
jgi:hypothetical protein